MSATFNRIEYDRYIAFYEKERAQRQAAEQVDAEQRRQRYEAVYAARFAALRAQGHSFDNADHFARRNATAAAATRAAETWR